ncbi:MAG: EAL domain-containing protein [Pseudomonadota bacterium]
MRHNTGKKGKRTSPLSMAVQQRDRNVMEMVRSAVALKRVMLAYQPVVQAKNHKRVAFYEGLIRVMDETGRIIPARQFINQIEEIELGRQIDCRALEMGLASLAEEPGLRLSINMSARSVGYREWMDVLDDGLRRNPTIGERLILEITETSAMTVPELVCSFMDDLQSRGISFALDDFGAGFTSLKHFKDFYFDILKIDGQFIRNIHQDPDNQVLVKALAGIGRQFEMFTVAEGVETAEDAAFLTSIGVDCLQGYHFAPPTIRAPWRQGDAQKSA